MGAETRGSLPIVGGGAGFVKAEQFGDRHPQRVEHDFRRDPFHPAAPQPVVSVIGLDHPERPLDLDAPIDPELYPLGREEVPLGFGLHPQEVEAGLERFPVRALAVLDETEAVIVERAAGAAFDGEELAARSRF